MQQSKETAQAAKKVFEANLRFLDLFLVKNLISEKQLELCKTGLTKWVEKGEQQYLDGLPELTDLIAPQVVYKECFKYNQIILRLARQFLRNTLTQQIQDQPDASVKNEIRKQLNRLDPLFSGFLDNVTQKYLAPALCSVDLLMLEENIIDASQLKFLHGSAIHLEIKSMDKKFGDLAIRNRFATKQGVKSALSEQTRRYLETGQNHIIGDILVERREMTPQIRDEILLLQNRFSEDEWESSLRQAVGSFIEQKEKSAVFGALVIREKFMDEAGVINALKQQSLEQVAYERRLKETPDGQAPEEGKEPRWIGDILVEDFGLSEAHRKRVVNLQMGQRIEIINLKFGVALEGAQRELIEALDQLFRVLYTENRLQAVLRVEREIPDTLTTTNITLWLYHKKITHGIISGAIRKLAESRVQPGEKIVVAQGTAPVPDKSFATQLFSEAHGPSCPAIVRNGDIIVRLERQAGESGMNVNHCFIAPPVIPAPLAVGPNVVRTKNEFLAGCDGMVVISDRGTVSISSRIDIPGNLDETCPAIDHDCDVHVREQVCSGVSVTCLGLAAREFNGTLLAREDVDIGAWAKGADITGHGMVNLAGVSGSRVVGMKNILIKKSKVRKLKDVLLVEDSTLVCRGFVIVTGLSVISSAVSAGEKIIFRNSRVDKNCRIMAGDTPEVFYLKQELEKKQAEFRAALDNMQSLQNEMQSIYSGMHETDFANLDREIDELKSKQPKTKFDMDLLRDLKKTRRQMEKDKADLYDTHGSTLLILSKKIPMAKKVAEAIEKETQLLGSRIQKRYDDNEANPEIDARKAVLARGVTLEFPHVSLTLDADSTGFIFREAFNPAEKRFEIKQYSW